MSKKDNWAGIRIPRSLYNQVRVLIEQPDSGYPSMSSFFSEAIRLRLEGVRKSRSLPPFRIDRSVDQEDHSLDH